MKDLLLKNVLEQSELEERFKTVKSKNEILAKLCNDSKPKVVFFTDFYNDKQFQKTLKNKVYSEMKVFEYYPTIFQDLQSKNENCEYCKHFQRGSVLPNDTEIWCERNKSLNQNSDFEEFANNCQFFNNR